MTITNDIGPFALTPLWVLERLVAIEQPEALRLYVALSKWTSGNDRTCHPSRATIARYVGCSIKTVTRHTAALESIGALQVLHRKTEDGDQTSNEYRLRTSLPGDTEVPTPTPTHVPTPRDTDVPRSNTHSEADPIEADKHLAPSQAMDAVLHVDYTAAFELFWATYRRTGSKRVAHTEWTKAIRRDTAERIQAGLERWVTYWDTPGSAKMKWPQGWLKEDRWLGDPPPIQQEASKHTRSLAVLDNARRQAQASRMIDAMFAPAQLTEGETS